MITFSRSVGSTTVEQADKYIDTRAGRGNEVEYNRSPKSSGKYRVERIRVTVDDIEFEFMRDCICTTEADHLAADLALADLSVLTKTDDPGKLGFTRITPK